MLLTKIKTLHGHGCSNRIGAQTAQVSICIGALSAWVLCMHGCSVCMGAPSVHFFWGRGGEFWISIKIEYGESF